jgi:methylenetetrahydrofolate dehydrogenase (NADP+)/methenyltetrahydrofolate cyclohydrolase
MAAALIDGKQVAAEMQELLAAEAAALRDGGIQPCLAVVLVGDDPASHTYVRSKIRTAARLGIDSRDHILPAATPREDVIELVRGLSADPKVHGILIQSPVPEPHRFREVLDAVDPRKDVDGLHPYNMGRLMAGPIAMPPCTPAGILELIRRAGVEPRGKEAVVVGRSDLVGKPVALLLLHAHATVTVCHSRTTDLPGVCRRADILVVAIGRAEMVGPEYVKPGALVIDVGINRRQDVDAGTSSLVGDVAFEAVREQSGAITPVPGGVGPMTITMLMRNTLTAARAQSAG